MGRHRHSRSKAARQANYALAGAPEGTKVPFAMNSRADLTKLALFQGLNEEALEVIAARAVIRRFRRGQVLWTAGSSPRGLFVVLEGKVRVVRAPDGRQYALHTEERGGTLGEVPLFSGGSYPATAVAAESTACLVLDRQVLGQAIAADPELAFRLLSRLADRVRMLVRRLDQHAGRPVAVRVASFLLARAEEATRGVTQAGSDDFTLGATQAEIAEELGTVREVLVRVLRRLREQGIIETVGRGRYRVVGWSRLHDLGRK